MAVPRPYEDRTKTVPRPCQDPIKTVLRPTDRVSTICIKAILNSWAIFEYKIGSLIEYEKLIIKIICLMYP